MCNFPYRASLVMGHITSFQRRHRITRSIDSCTIQCCISVTLVKIIFNKVTASIEGFTVFDIITILLYYFYAATTSNTTSTTSTIPSSRTVTSDRHCVMVSLEEEFVAVRLSGPATAGSDCML